MKLMTLEPLMNKQNTMLLGNNKIKLEHNILKWSNKTNILISIILITLSVYLKRGAVIEF